MSKKSLLVVLALALAASIALIGCSGEPKVETPNTPAAETPAPETPQAETPAAPTEEVTELKSEDIKVGDGAEATTGKQATVHYTLWLSDGTKLESSKDGGQPFTFALGAGNVIPGWDQGVPGMKVGGVRKLTIPPDLAYGPSGSGPIPPNATLVFEIELLGVQ